jgi:sulfur relay (sulfurtransferase) complex TusBCD TusD component (DsrE family)
LGGAKIGGNFYLTNKKINKMNEQIKRDVENIKLCIDAAIQKGVFTNLEQAFTISQSLNNIVKELSKADKLDNGNPE